MMSFSSMGQLYYRSFASGNWNVPGTWESAPAAVGPWVTAVATPTTADYSITIQSPHVVTVTVNVTIDEVTINLGGTISSVGAAVVTVNNGLGIDLTINGTFIENSTASIVFGAARWVMSSGSTLIKTSGAAGANWQNAYNLGIANIPANANWILRKIGAANPSLNTTVPASGSVYPNLIIENNTVGIWAPASASSSVFTGFAAFPTVKGNLDIGGSGTSTVSFLNEQTNATPTLVNGNVIVRPGNILRNYGTGLNIQGDLTVNGTINYDAADARRLVFSGGNAQTINGAGTLGIYYMQMNKSANALTLNRPITIDNQLALTWGKINSTTVNIPTIIDVATVVGANNNSFVTGPIRKNGDNAFVFPVGKNNDYQAIGMSSGGGGGSVTFWTENFGTGCNQGQLATSYPGSNGLWTQTLVTANQPEANAWYVSATEAGMGTGNCGNGCLSNGGLTNRTLHVGANDGFTASDPGAAYNAGGLCGILFCVTTDKRIQSPVINCTGHSNVNLSFNYIENGDGINDNAMLSYYDGAVWSDIFDMPKTPNNCGGQGRWTYTTITLPASANNNPNVKIGFRWVNNDDGVGTDPSFAVDDIQLSDSPSDVFTAEYFRGNPRTLFGTTTVPSLISISGCEYWQLDRNAGSSNRIVSLDWDLNSCGITNLGNLRVARWEVPGTIWRDEGNGGAFGALAAGTIPSGNFISTYGIFTLSAVDAQPLPVELLDFDAVYNGKTVDLKWTTVSEINNDFFTIERSTDATDFIPIGNKKGAGNSTGILNYYLNDKLPLIGVSYYRIRQTDFDGKSTLSKPVRINISNDHAFAVYADALSQQIIIQTDYTTITSGKIEIIDGLGKVVLVHSFSVVEPLILQTENLTRGIYYARLISTGAINVVKFAY